MKNDKKREGLWSKLQPKEHSDDLYLGMRQTTSRRAHIHTPICMCVCKKYMCTCMHMHVETRRQPQVSVLRSHLALWNTVSHWLEAQWFNEAAWWAPATCHPHTGIASMPPHLAFVCRFWGLNFDQEKTEYLLDIWSVQMNTSYYHSSKDREHIRYSRYSLG